jgi:hypothetical protein
MRMAGAQADVIRNDGGLPGNARIDGNSEHGIAGRSTPTDSVRMDSEGLLALPGLQDLSVHVDFSALAEAAHDIGLEVLGYATQARFLLNCGLLDMLHGADLPAIGNAQKLINEHEMGELFKVVGLAKGCNDAFMAAPLGFLAGDRMHTL